MGFRESFTLPEDCALRQNFPGGDVYVQTSGSEPSGSTHVNLYAQPFESVPRVPVLHLILETGGAATVEQAFIEAHEVEGKSCSLGLGCAALDAVQMRVTYHQDMPGVQG